MARIVVVGSFNVDLTTYVERLPLPGETLPGKEFTTGPGGKGSNQAVAAARLGGDVTFIGKVADDAFATMAFDLWQGAGIDTRYVQRDSKQPTGTAIIFVEDSSENVIIITGGANMALTVDDINAAEGAIAEADVLLTQLEVDMDVVAHALALARKHHTRTVLNPAPARHLPQALLNNVDILTPNTTELEILREQVTLPVSSEQGLVVTHGARGVHWQQGSTDSMVPAFEVDVVDTVGAGDAFNGGLAVAVGDGLAMPDTLRFATAAAALSVTRRGASESMPTREEVEAFLAGR